MPPRVDRRRKVKSSDAHRQHAARWQLLPNELWAHIATSLDTYDKMVRLVAYDVRRTRKPNCFPAC